MHAADTLDALPRVIARHFVSRTRKTSPDLTNLQVVAGEPSKGGVSAVASSTISIETSMHQRMASGTQGDQVLFGVMSALIAKLLVVNL